ncbi:hypothetical protein HDV00_010922 [Rhizophlyctis rosea]|nr:hypothetical protein HDV00_010922 [Rhizophlyctis rosea]
MSAATKKPTISTATYHYLRRALQSLYHNGTRSTVRPTPHRGIRHSSSATATTSAAIDPDAPLPKPIDETFFPSSSRHRFRESPESPTTSSFKPFKHEPDVDTTSNIQAFARIAAWKEYVHNLRVNPDTNFKPLTHTQFRNVLNMLRTEPDVSERLRLTRRVLDHMAEYGVPIGDEERALLAQCLGVNRQIKQAIQMLETMVCGRGWGFPEARDAVKILVEQCRMAGNVEVAGRLLSGILATPNFLEKRFSKSLLFQIVETYARSGDLEGADDAMIRLYVAGMRPSERQLHAWIMYHYDEWDQTPTLEGGDSNGNMSSGKRDHSKVLAALVRFASVIADDLRVNSSETKEKMALYAMLVSEALKCGGTAQASVMTTQVDAFCVAASLAFLLWIADSLT